MNVFFLFFQLEDDQGEYTVKAENSYGKANVTFSLKIQSLFYF